MYHVRLTGVCVYSNLVQQYDYSDLTTDNSDHHGHRPANDDGGTAAGCSFTSNHYQVVVRQRWPWLSPNLTTMPTKAPSSQDRPYLLTNSPFKSNVTSVKVSIPLFSFL